MSEKIVFNKNDIDETLKRVNLFLVSKKFSKEELKIETKNGVFNHKLNSFDIILSTGKFSFSKKECKAHFNYKKLCKAIKINDNDKFEVQSANLLIIFCNYYLCIKNNLSVDSFKHNLSIEGTFSDNEINHYLKTLNLSGNNDLSPENNNVNNTIEATTPVNTSLSPLEKIQEKYKMLSENRTNEYKALYSSYSNLSADEIEVRDLTEEEKEELKANNNNEIIQALEDRILEIELSDEEPLLKEKKIQAIKYSIKEYQKENKNYQK